MLILVGAAVAVASTIAAVQRSTDIEPLAIAVLREAATAASAIPRDDTTRIALLRAIAHAQVNADDVDGALATATQMGVWRVRVRTDAVCRLLEARRFDDARALIRRFSKPDGDWALARMAVQLADPPWPRNATRDTLDTAALSREAIVTARGIRSTAPRIDALIAIGERALSRSDTSTARTAIDEALRNLAGVRDPNFASSRRYHIASHLGRMGRTDSALVVVRSLSASDRIELLPQLASWRGVDPSAVRREVDELAPLIDTIRDPRAKANAASGLVRALYTLGDADHAATIERRTTLIDSTTGKPWRWNVVRPTTIDRAVALVQTDIGRAIAVVDTVDDPVRIGRRARAYLRLEETIWYRDRNTAALLLRRARRSALDTQLAPTGRDDLLATIAGEQVRQGFFDDAVITIDAISDPAASWPAFTYLGESAQARLSVRERRQFIARLANGQVREAAIAHVVEQSTGVYPRSKLDDAYAIALADSLPPGEPRERAQLAVARRALAFGDTVTATRRLLALLADHRIRVTAWARDHWPEDLIATLIAAGAADPTLAWAQSLPGGPQRAAALLDIGIGLHARAARPPGLLVGNGPDLCRDTF